MPVRWFRITFARNAFLRVLSERGASLEELTVAEGIRAMGDFARGHRPQHAELDLAYSVARAVEGGYELSVVRRMRRHDYPESALTLAFDFDERGQVVARTLTQS